MYQLAERTVVGAFRQGRVGRVAPAAGPRDRYMRGFPRRRVTWNAALQCFEVRERNPATGRDERVSLVQWSIRDKDTNVEVRGFRPFNHAYVSERLEDWRELQRLGVSGFGRKVMRSNQAKELAVARAKRQRFDDFAREDRRWLGVLAALLDGRPRGEALVEKVPMVSPGISLSATGRSSQ